MLVDAPIHLLPDRLARAIWGDAPNTVVTIEQAVAHVRALGLDGDAARLLVA